MNDANSTLLKTSLKSQYHATLETLRRTIVNCPDDLWYSTEYMTTFWQLAYHTLFFAHLYSQVDEASARPWEHQQSNVQNPDAIPGDPDPKSDLPLIPNPYTREQVLDYWKFCDDNIDNWVDALDLENPESGFWWYKMPKIEHQIVNIRHIQHGAAQLADRLRSKLNIGIGWVGSGRKQ